MNSGVQDSTLILSWSQQGAVDVTIDYNRDGVTLSAVKKDDLPLRNYAMMMRSAPTAMTGLLLWHVACLAEPPQDLDPRLRIERPGIQLTLVAEHPDVVERLTRLGRERAAQISSQARPVGKLAD